MTAVSPAAVSPRWAFRALVLALLAAAYFGAARLGLSFALIHESVSAIWPPSGIAIAATLIFGAWVAPAVFAAAWLVNGLDLGALPALGIATGNTLEALAAGALVRRFAAGTRCFDRPRDIFLFALLAALASTAIAASFGVASLHLAGRAPTADLGSIWMTWWLGDAVGALVITPLIVLWAANPRPTIAAGRRAEAAAMTLVVLAMSLLVFVAFHKPIAFVMLGTLAWAAFRFGPREVATVLALQAVVAVYGTTQGAGPFATGSVHESLLLLQAFMGVIAITLLAMAALVELNRRALGQAAAAARSKDEFLATLAHELRNPLAPLQNSLELLALTGERQVPPDIIRMMSRQLSHLVRLVDDLLDVARLTGGAILLQKEPIDLREAIEMALEISRPVITADGHAVEARLPEARLVVLADRNRLAQVVSNLLNNAAKFTRPPGRIQVVVERAGKQAVVRVIDNGIGIPREMLESVFQMFTQLRPVIGRFGGGLGVGLALVRSLVQMHGGTVEARSEGPGRGSEFIVRLPLSEQAPRAVAPVHGPAPVARGGRRVLVVDDNRDAAASMAFLLRELGHEIHVAHNGVESLRMADELRPDVLLLDIGMPDMSGYEVATALRARPWARDLLIVAITGWGQPEDRQRTAAAGFDHHLVKPVAAADMAAVLERRRAAAS